MTVLKILVFQVLVALSCASYLGYAKHQDFTHLDWSFIELTDKNYRK